MEGACHPRGDTKFTTQTAPPIFRDFRGCHAGETILVCGCGSSLSRLTNHGKSVTIGVNDIGRLFDPDYLVVLNPRQQFSGDRFRYVEESRARAVFSQLALGIDHPRQIRFRLGRRAGTDLSDDESLPYTDNSPYVALCLAAWMGASRIGLIGVDFTDHHFFAPTGPHSLSRSLDRIDREYRNLTHSLIKSGIEVRNLSHESRLTCIPKSSPEVFFAAGGSACISAVRSIFIVGYKFLSCGSVFDDGLAGAARELSLRSKSANWDDPRLAEKVAAFQPDLLFVIHGRQFSSRWRSLAQKYRSAVWLLDEPYEVDDTARFSGMFDTVFVNDPSTVHRHRNAHYLPVCFDPAAYTRGPDEGRAYAVGFIGGANPWREEALVRLARKGLLSYVVGGPWCNPELRRLCLSGNIPAEETAPLYRGTRLVVNLFRTRHHFNAAKIPAVSLNPRIYEALACGALVISEHRPELDTVFPELPAFRTLDEMELLITRYLGDREAFAQALEASIGRLDRHTYARRLSAALTGALGQHLSQDNKDLMTTTLSIPSAVSGETYLPAPEPVSGFAAAWEMDLECVRTDPDGGLTLKQPPGGAGNERGLMGTTRYKDVTLEFEILLRPDTQFIAQIRQVGERDQLANSYHLMCMGSRAYVARQNHVFRQIRIPVGRWAKVSYSCCDSSIELRVDGALMAKVIDGMLESGHCFLGIKSGVARLRNIRAGIPGMIPRESAIDYEIVKARHGTSRAISIVTTVYDRVDCLEQCIRSVQELRFRDCEQIIVADAPSGEVLKQLEDLVSRYDPDGENLALVTLKSRRNDWGISPASAGVSLAKGRYLCFLSDDNGYVPTHFDRLFATLEGDPSLGFVYSSCLYAGRGILNSAVPRPARIDLGQPLFRRELFDWHLGGGLPFNEFGWDWRMIEHFMQRGVRWKHLNQATFIFRLASYPHLMARSGVGQSA